MSIFIFTLDTLAYQFFDFRILKCIQHHSFFFHNELNVNFSTELTMGCFYSDLLCDGDRKKLKCTSTTVTNLNPHWKVIH